MQALAFIRQERLRLYDDERPTPIEKPGQYDHHGPKSWRGFVWLRIAFSKERELFAKKEILGHKIWASPEEQSDEGEQLRILQALWKVFDDLDHIFADYSCFCGHFLRIANTRSLT